MRSVLVTVGVVAIAGCSASHTAAGSTSKTDPVIVVAAVPAPGAAALYLGAERGYFKAAGLDVRIESSVSASDIVPSLVHGSVAVALGQWTSALDAAAGGAKLTAIGPGNSGGPGLEEIVAAPGSGITRVSQLRGKTIAVNALAGLPDALTDSVLAASGIPASAVHYTAVPFPSMAAALSAHRVSAAFMVQPYLQATSKMTVLADIDQLPATHGIPVTGYYTAQAWAAGHETELTEFTRALAQGQRLAASDPAAARQAIARYTRVSPAVAARMALGTFPLSVRPGDLERVGSLMQRYGLLPREADVTALATGMTS